MQSLSPAHQKKQVICLMAPTASGKTALAYQLYETGKYELISVDSALVYRDMNIGTAKPSAEELEKYPHHLVDIIDPTQSYSVADFVNDVERLINDIHARGRTPLLIGGTMMYFMALFEGLSNVPNSDPKVREEVEAWRQREGIAALYTYLRQVDPDLWERLKPNDTQRISRAVEVYKQTGKPLSYWQDKPKVALADNPLQTWIGLIVMPDRAWLHKRIEQRLDVMWQQGLVDEVIGLIKKYPLTANMASMRCVGYRQVLDYLFNKDLVSASSGSKSLQNAATVTNDKQALNNLTLDINNGCSVRGDKYLNLEVMNHQAFMNKVPDAARLPACQDMINQALYATRQLAKRQYTWLRKFDKMATPYQELLSWQSSKVSVLPEQVVEQLSIDEDALERYNNFNLPNHKKNNIFISFDNMTEVEHYFDNLKV